ncbi:hypothetical protein IWX48DRAFT_593995 [Phyllosticta citricarpa]
MAHIPTDRAEGTGQERRRQATILTFVVGLGCIKCVWVGWLSDRRVGARETGGGFNQRRLVLGTLWLGDNQGAVHQCASLSTRHGGSGSIGQPGGEQPPPQDKVAGRNLVVMPRAAMEADSSIPPAAGRPQKPASGRSTRGMNDLI